MITSTTLNSPTIMIASTSNMGTKQTRALLNSQTHTKALYDFETDTSYTDVFMSSRVSVHFTEEMWS